MFTIAAFDNFDHEEATLSGIGGSHDTVSVLFQDMPADIPHKPNISETSVVHDSKVFTQDLPCQDKKEYIKPPRKADIPSSYIVSEEQYHMDKHSYEAIKCRDTAWSNSRLDLSSINSGIVKPICDNRTMPSLCAFNSLTTEEQIHQKILGFIPLLPYPVTEHETVYTAMKNFQDINKL